MKPNNIALEGIYDDDMPSVVAWWLLLHTQNYGEVLIAGRVSCDTLICLARIFNKVYTLNKPVDDEYTYPENVSKVEKESIFKLNLDVLIINNYHLCECQE